VRGVDRTGRHHSSGALFDRLANGAAVGVGSEFDVGEENQLFEITQLGHRLRSDGIKPHCG
jgi:hypothetical protein